MILKSTYCTNEVTTDNPIDSTDKTVNSTKEKIWDIMVRKGIISEDKLIRLLIKQKASKNISIWKLFIREWIITKEELMELLIEQNTKWKEVTKLLFETDWFSELNTVEAWEVELTQEEFESIFWSQITKIKDNKQKIIENDPWTSEWVDPRLRWIK